MARPIPLVEPVTRATFPLSFMGATLLPRATICNRYACGAFVGQEKKRDKAMRFDGPGSSNVEYDSGRTSSLGGMGGGIIGLLFQLVLSRFGIIGLVILGLGYCALTSLGGGLGGGGGTASSENGKTISVSPDTDKFARQVLGSTEQV